MRSVRFAGADGYAFGFDAGLKKDGIIPTNDKTAFATGGGRVGEKVPPARPESHPRKALSG